MMISEFLTKRAFLLGIVISIGPMCEVARQFAAFKPRRYRVQLECSRLSCFEGGVRHVICYQGSLGVTP